MKLFFLKIIFFISLVSQISFAATSSQGSNSGNKHKYFLAEVNALFGFGSSQISTDSSSPNIDSANLGLGVGLNIRRFTLGVSYDYRSLVQMSDTDPNVGNRRGTFISPGSVFVKLNFDAIHFGFMLVNSGKYEISNTTITGQKLSYTNPSGFRFNINFRKLRGLNPTFFYESVSFSGKELDGTSSTLTNNLNYSNYGLGVRYEF